MSGFGPEDRLARVELVGAPPPPLGPDARQDLDVALYDLAEENAFRPRSGGAGPFRLGIGLEGGALILEIAPAEGTPGEPAETHRLPLGRLRETVEDYAAVTARYRDAVRGLGRAGIEAIDAERREVHGEGAALVRAALAPVAETDAQTARRLFTAIAALAAPG